MTADMTVTTLFEAFKGGGGMNGGASISGGAAVLLKIHVFWQNVQTWVSDHHHRIVHSARIRTAGAGGPGWSHQDGNLVSGNGDNVQTLIDHLANEGYEINRDPNDWNNGSPTKPGLHMYDVYNTIKRYGYQDQNTTEGEVSIPLSAIEELVVKRAVRANVKPAEYDVNDINITGYEGIQVYLPLGDGWDYSWDFISGGRIFVDENGISWDVGRDGIITGRTPMGGYGPDVNLVSGTFLKSSFKSISKSFLKKNGILDIHAFKKEWLGTDKNLKFFDVVKNTDSGELLIVRKSTQEIIVNTKIIVD
jgi:hypothetical protein